MEGARQVHPDHPLPRVEVDLEERPELLESGIVHEDGGGSEALCHLGDGRFHPGPVGDIGFDADRNEVTIISHDEVVEVPETTKWKVAQRVLDQVVRIRERRKSPVKA